jgi:Ser/Thr protein kinase RdoA (MazF antagonist)
MFAMTTSPANPADDAIARTIRQSFPLQGPIHLIPGGEGRTYRAGDHVYRLEARPAEATYVAEVYAALPASGFRIPRPIPSFHGTWLSPDGWSAWSFVAGQPATPSDVSAALDAITVFHQALASASFPAFLATKDTPYTRADIAAWGTVPDDLDTNLRALIAPLLALRQPLPPLAAQVIHVDLNDKNLLIAPGVPPAIIDFTPSWRPPAYAVAVFAYWIGPYRENRAILEQFVAFPAFDQLLLRVALSKLLTMHEFRKQGQNINSSAASFQTPVRLIREWMNRPSAL